MAFENGTSHRGVMSLSWRAADFARAIESLRWKTNRHIATYGVMSHSSHGGQSRCGHTAILTIGATPPDMVTRCAVRAGFVRFLHDHRRSYRQLTFQKRDCLGRRISRCVIGFQARTAQRDLGRDRNLSPLRFPPARLEAPSAAPKLRPHIDLVIGRQGLAHPIAFAMST